MDLQGKKVLVTGAGGFIASHLVEALLAKKANVTCFVRYTSSGSRGFLDTFPNKCAVVRGDLNDADALRSAMKGIDVVFHLGAMIAIPHSYDMPREAVQTNVLGTFNVLIAARDAGVKRVIHTSTSEVYGSALRVPIDESHPLQGQSPYSASKIGADKLAESFCYAYGLPVTIVRPFNTFGPRQSARAIIPTIITQALTKGEVTLGSTNTTRDFLYVKDTVRGFLAAAENDVIGETINLGTGREISIADLAQTIFRLTGKKAKIVRDEERVRPKNSEVMRLCADASKAKRVLGWEPEYNLEEGLKETIEYIKEHLDEYRIDEYNK